MTRIEYLEKHHELSGTLIGIVSVCDSVEDIKKYLNIYQPKLNEIYTQRIHSLAIESNWNEEELDNVLEMVR